MLCVIEGGSTKADWIIAANEDVRLKTIGFNPYFHTTEFVFETLNKSKELIPFKDMPLEIKYFGAGCSSAERKEIIASGFRKYFINAEVYVDHDLLASVYATCGDSEGIACIIGTGSNSCYFDGKTIYEKNYGLGYILGDKGSGSYYGKKLVTSFLYGVMPENIYKDFQDTYKLDKNSIINKVYKEPEPNVWLASFSKFLTAHRSDPWIQHMIRHGMREFIELYVCHYDRFRQLPVHFVGSIAYVFKEELIEVAHTHFLNVGKIIKQPIDELMNYFMERK
jgi:N-acetylglucosamine kinase-like BadF-type ATPase